MTFSLFYKLIQHKDEMPYKKVFKKYILNIIYMFKISTHKRTVNEYPYIILYIYAYKSSMGQTDDPHDGGKSKVQEQECL